MNNNNISNLTSNEKLLKRIQELEDQVSKLQRQKQLDDQRIEHLEELLRLRNKELYARKSEQNTDGGVQLSLFDDIELNKAIEEQENEVEKCEEKIAKLSDNKDKVKAKRKEQSTQILFQLKLKKNIQQIYLKVPF